ncbi:MAG TPA: DUF3870 domain-containing protein [Firmicutes bacterium]|nr:DUF3870 domain-containing protein [Bacillota bacterium]
MAVSAPEHDKTEDLRTILVTGYAKAPQGTSMYEVYKHAGIVLEIDPLTHTIVDAQFTVVTPLAGRFLRDLLVGYQLERGLDPLIQEIRHRYLAPSQEALIKALRVAVQRYQDRST